jgi:DNA-binding CsgD family transcriptional regulator
MDKYYIYTEMIEVIIKKKFISQKMTSREIEVMKFWFLNYNYRDIALQLNISENTVKTYIKHITKKLGGDSKLTFIICLMEMIILNAASKNTHFG